MKDYLSRAAERATGANATIRPVLPSFFDADKSNLDAGSVIPESSTGERVSHAQRQLSPNAATIEKQMASVLALAPEHFSESSKEKQTVSNASLGTSTSTRPRVTKEEERQTPMIPVRPRVTLAESSQEESVALSLNRDEPPVDSLPKPKTQPVRPRTIDRRRVGISNRTRSKNSFSDDRSSPAEPSIQVTIGRLEVRAVQQAPAPSKPAPKSTRMSLEEYLRSEDRKSR